jgi:hypothetical protein
MTKTFTQNDLMRFLYHETNEDQTKAISKAVLNDPELRAQLAEMISSKKVLDAAQLEPSTESVLNILSYARGLQEH